MRSISHAASLLLLAAPTCVCFSPSLSAPALGRRVGGATDAQRYPPSALESTPSALWSSPDAQLEGGASESDPICVAGSICDWLNREVKEGYGAKYSPAFIEVGIDDQLDLLNIDDALMQILNAELLNVGAKPMHLKNIKKALEASACAAPTAPPHVGYDTSGADAPLLGAAALLKTALPEDLTDADDDVALPDLVADAEEVFVAIDRNGDGVISRDELRTHLLACGYTEAAVAALYGTFDVDANGEVSQSEFQLAFTRFTPLRVAPGLGAYNSQFVDAIQEDADAMFDAIDTDADGSISKDELREHMRNRAREFADAAVDRMFGVIDTNNDGVLSRSELRGAFVRSSALRLATGGNWAGRGGGGFALFGRQKRWEDK